jgi:ATP-dependent Clp protease ATP-binding subunit ClpC
MDSDSFEEFIARYLQGQRAAQSGRPIDVTRLLSRRTYEILAHAANFAVEKGHGELDALHILRVLTQQSPATDAIRRIGVDPAQIAEAAEQRLPADAADRSNAAPPLTASAQRALLDAYQVARAFGSTYIDPEHLFFAFVVNQDSSAGQVLNSLGVTPQALQSGQASAPQSSDAPAQSGSNTAAADAASAKASTESATPTLDTFGTDLTARAREGALDPVIGRSVEIEQTVEILSRRTKNNPVLIGEAGVGKTAIVEGLAQAIASGDVPEQLRAKRVISLDFPAILAGTRFRGDLEDRLTKLMDEISAHRNELIVFIDELHTVIGSSGTGGADAANILKPRLARGELHLVGATTLGEYREVEKDPAFERRFQPVTVGEPNIDDAVQILMGLRTRYEEHHGVRYTDASIRAAVEMSARYITDRRLPDKAIDLIDQAGARLQLKLGARGKASVLRTEIAELEASKSTAVAEERYEDASRLRDQIDRAQASLRAIAPEGTTGRLAAVPYLSPVIGETQIAEVISRATGIPASKLTADDREQLAKLEDQLHARVVGQHDAVASIAKAIRRSRTGMGDPNRPVGSFLFLGPTGVGKTELAKALTESLFGDESKLLRFDMSEFGERHTVSRLVGAPPGYVGYGEAGQLTERVRRNPFSVVLLDEIEKAHPDVFNILLQVLDDGRLTDGQGRTVDFRNTVIVMTSNLGSEFLASRGGALGFVADSANGFGSEKELRDRVMGKVREAMRPEFINRIDDIMLFRKLDQDQVRSIVRLLLDETESRLAKQDIGFDVSDEAIDWIVAEGYQPEYGARPLRRVIQREVDDRIADLLVGSELVAGGRASVTVQGGALSVAGDDVVLLKAA